MILLTAIACIAGSALALCAGLVLRRALRPAPTFPDRPNTERPVEPWRARLDAEIERQRPWEGKN